MTTRSIAPAFVAATALVLAACQTPGDQTSDKTVAGAGLGALGGAAIGGIVDDGGLAGILIGAGIGALAGGTVGGYMDQQEAALRDDLAGSGVEVERRGEDIVLSVPSNVTFDFDSADLKPQVYPTLNSIASTLREYEQTTVRVVGHTDSTGADDYNVDLSLRRAQSVSRYLQGQGVIAPRIAAFGAGEAQPVASNATDAGRAANRRVELIVQPFTG